MANVTQHDVNHLPDLSYHLLSLRIMGDLGHEYRGNKEGLSVAVVLVLYYFSLSRKFESCLRLKGPVKPDRKFKSRGHCYHSKYD